MSDEINYVDGEEDDDSCVCAETAHGKIEIDSNGKSWKWSYKSNDNEVSVCSADSFQWLQRAKVDVEKFVKRIERQG